jgi:RNA polymerase sigma-70 factor (sigma-E family)
MTHSLDPPGGEPAPVLRLAAVTPVSTARDETFATLYRDRYAAMVRLAHLITGSNAVAPDLVQDAFVKVAARLGTIEQPGAYLRAVVVNECRSWIRRQAVERKHLPTEAPAASLPPDVDEMWAALTKLPERQRAALVLRYYEDLSLDDIARTLGCRLGTAKSLVHRGLASLKEVLEP